MMVFIDAHVHIHACFSLSQCLDAAYLNFCRAAEARAGSDKPWVGFLLLTESNGTDIFSGLQKSVHRPSHFNKSWRFQSTSEDISIEAVSPGKDRMINGRMFLVAGGQIVTVEKLEVLCLGSRHRFEDHMPLNQTIDRILEAGALAVLPWGPGKWFFKRGKILSETVRHFGNRVFLGDNGNRPRFWPTPGIFRIPQAAGCKILPGSDPLPFPSESGRAGSFGFMIDGSISEDKPAEDLIKHLRRPGSTPEPYGNLESAVRFFHNQLNMQLIKSGIK